MGGQPYRRQGYHQALASCHSALLRQPSFDVIWRSIGSNHPVEQLVRSCGTKGGCYAAALAPRAYLLNLVEDQVAVNVHIH